MTYTTDTRNTLNLYRYRQRKTRWLHDWHPGEPRTISRKPWHERMANWAMLLSALYVVGQIVRFFLS